MNLPRFPSFSLPNLWEKLIIFFRISRLQSHEKGIKEKCLLGNLDDFK